ncbi:MAG TPA: beta-ketoacyl synthase N-terminal-like domain-containing protein, partial [Rheinheimera sp.]|nr:beta-ketoacyl synthase N-terminal-like domain-containing protein [Rheinheimera sp.]
MAKRRVVVTGLGMLTPLGNDVASSWQGLQQGKSGISLIEHFDTSAYTTKFAGLLKNFDVEPYFPAKDAKKMDLFIQYGVAAGIQAFRDSGIEITAENAPRIGAAIGSGIGGLGLIEENHTKLLNSGPKRLSPFFVPSTIINMI